MTNVKLLSIIMILTAILAGCKTASYENGAKFTDVYDNYQEERLLTGVDSLDLNEYEIKFEGAKLRDVVDSLNRLSGDFTVYLAVQDLRVAETFSDGFSVGSSSSSSSSVGVDKEFISLGVPSPSAEVTGSFSMPSGFGSARPKSADDVVITGLFVGRIDEIVRDISSIAGLDWEMFGNRYYIGGSLRDYMVTATVETSLDESSVNQIARLYGVVIVRTSNKLTITGRCKRVRLAYDMIVETSENPQSYNIDLILVDVSENNLSDIRAKVEVTSVDLIQKGVQLWDVFKATGFFSLGDVRSYNYVDQELYCTDGKSVRLSIGREVKREQRAISDQGTSTVSGYSTNNDGLRLDLMPIRSTNGCVNMTLQYEDSSFGNDDLSKTTTSLDYTGVSFELGKMYYLTSVESRRRSRSLEFLGVRDSKDRTVTTIWLCVRPVQSKVVKK